MTSVPAADVEGAVLDQIQKLLAAPELVARTWATTKRVGEDEITEREVIVLLADFATIWSELFHAEQARIVQLLSRSRCGSGPKGWRVWSASCSSRVRGKRHDSKHRN